MAGNGNPVDTLKEKRMTAHHNTAVEYVNTSASQKPRPVTPIKTGKDMAAELLSQFREVGINGTRTGIDDLDIPIDDVDNSFGTDSTRDIQDGILTQRDLDLNNSIALEYEATRGDKTPIKVIAENLRKGVFKDVSNEYLQTRLSEIVAAAPDRITFAMAGKILEQSQDQLKAEGTFGRFGQNLSGSFWNSAASGLFGRGPEDLGNGQTINNDKVTRYTNEIKSGLVDVNLSTAKNRQAAASSLAASKKAVTDAEATYTFVLDKARAGNQRMVALLPNIKRKVDEAKNSLRVTEGLGAAQAYAPPIDDAKTTATMQADKLAEAARRFYGSR